jgi:hypothetical protein
MNVPMSMETTSARETRRIRAVDIAGAPAHSSLCRVFFASFATVRDSPGLVIAGDRPQYAVRRFTLDVTAGVCMVDYG